MMKAQYTHTNTNPLNLVLRSTRFFFRQPALSLMLDSPSASKAQANAPAGDLTDDGVIVDCQAC